MKKICTNLFLLICLSFGTAYGQLNYTVSKYTANYTSLTNATNPALDNPTPTGYYEDDEGFANQVPIGFTFNFNQTNYSRLNINVNGFVTFGADFPMQVDDRFNTNSLANGPKYPNMMPLLAPLWDDLRLKNNQSLRYKLSGTAPYRVFAIEWDNVRWSVSSGGDVLAFQMRLYETTNVIEYTYKSYSLNVVNGSASIGIAASVGNFISLNRTEEVSTYVEYNNVNVAPADNVVFKFEPAKISMPIGLKVDTYNSRKASFVWNNLSVSDYEYAITPTPIEASSNAFVYTTQKNVTINGLQPATQYYLQVRSAAGSARSAVAILAFRTPKETTLTYSENFNNEIVPQIANALTVTSPTGGAKWVSEKVGYTLPYNTALACKGDNSTTNNAWFMLPGMYLDGGKSYKIKFRYKISDTSFGKQKFEIRIGNLFNNSTTGWTTVYKNYKVLETTFKDTAVILAPNTSDIWFIAFRNVSDVNNTTFYVDDIEVTNVSAMPAKVVQFSGTLNNNKTELQWKTSGELNCAKFELQKSVDGSSYSTIQTIASKAANGTSTVDIDYEAEDNAVFSTTTHYRLRIYDTAGNAFSSQTIVVKAPLPNELVLKKVYPNPAINVISGIIVAATADKGYVLVQNLLGNTISMLPITINIGDNLFSIDVSKLAKGMYTIKYISQQTNQGSTSLKFVK